MTPPFTAPFSTIGNFSDLCEYLREEGVAHSPDAATQVVEIPTSSGALVGTMLVRWDQQLPLVQIIQLMLDIPAERMAAAERAIGILNHAAPLPGFAYDYERGFAYFRITLQRDERDQVTVPQLNRALGAAVANARDFLPILHAVAHPQPPAAEPAEPVTADPDPAPGPG